MADPLVIAHVAHYTWVLYIPPVLIVLVSIARSVIAERRRGREGLPPAE